MSSHAVARASYRLAENRRSEGCMLDLTRQDFSVQGAADADAAVAAVSSSSTAISSERFTQNEPKEFTSGAAA